MSGGLGTWLKPVEVLLLLLESLSHSNGSGDELPDLGLSTSYGSLGICVGSNPSNVFLYSSFPSKINE